MPVLFSWPCNNSHVPQHPCKHQSLYIEHTTQPPWPRLLLWPQPFPVTPAGLLFLGSTRHGMFSGPLNIFFPRNPGSLLLLLLQALIKHRIMRPTLPKTPFLGVWHALSPCPVLWFPMPFISHSRYLLISFILLFDRCWLKICARHCSSITKWFSAIWLCCS